MGEWVLVCGRPFSLFSLLSPCHASSQLCVMVKDSGFLQDTVTDSQVGDGQKYGACVLHVYSRPLHSVSFPNCSLCMSGWSVGTRLVVLYVAVTS